MDKDLEQCKGYCPACNSEDIFWPKAQYWPESSVCVRIGICNACDTACIETYKYIGTEIA